MDRRSIKKSAIEAALPTVAIVLIGIITDYFCIEPHSFVLTQPVRIIYDGDSDNDDDDKPRQIIWPQIINLDANTQTLIHLDTGNDEDDANPWHTYVSNGSFGTAPRRWTVGYVRQSADDESGWIGAGITTAVQSTANFGCLDLYGISTDASWIVRMDLKLRPGPVYHAGKTASMPSIESDLATTVDPDLCLRTGCRADSFIDFEADRSTLRITARFTADKTGSSFVVHTAATTEDFDVLRPCVVLAGRIAATVVSDCSS